MNKDIKENSFDPAGGGMSGTLNYQSPIRTYSSPSVSQNPKHFGSSDYNNFYNTSTTGQPDIKTSDGIDRMSLEKEVEELFKEKEKPTVDDVITGIQYELSRMIKKDINFAKQTVIDKMLEYGPKFYTSLDMLNIDDKKMDPLMKERINILDKMIEEKENSKLKLNDSILNILKEKKDQKQNRFFELLTRI